LARRPVEREACEFCSLSLPPSHRHLVEVAAHRIVCACDACALRFDNVIGRWKLIPRDSRRIDSFRMTDAQWESLSLPIGLAFFSLSTATGKVTAMYPSPAGATESLVPLSNWAALVEQNVALAQMQPDVEALLVNRLKERREYFLAAIDTCYELVGIVRLHWRGFSGGDRVWDELDRFFERLRGSASPQLEVSRAGEVAHA